MYTYIVLAPLRGSLLAGFAGKALGPQGASLLTVSTTASAFLCSLFAFQEVALQGSPVSFQAFPWMISGPLQVYWGFLFDQLTVVMLRVVRGVSTLVHIYSTEYMAGDPHRARFMSYLSLFTFFMLILVTGDNYLQLFVGWEGVGLCSYLLINFWYTRIQANKAAIKAMLVNRVGDVALVLAMLAMYVQYGSLDYYTVFALAPLAVQEERLFRGLPFHAITLISVLLFLGAVGKSAQLGLHTWLPDAMEGPTPVSALIHAATMVTAGVFLLARSSPLLEYSSTARTLITVFGAATAFFAASVGLVQNDLKRVIAYSTCSQLGYMIFACGLSAYSVGVFHLANHAAFKALLFLSAGSVIHALGDEQDMRRMGGLVRVLPLTYAMIFIGSLALMGFPFLTGFYSKDVILEVAAASSSTHGTFAHLRGCLGAFCTAFYSLRLLYLTFLSQPAGHRSIYEGAHDAPLAMALPLLLLCLASLGLGWFSKDLIIGVGTPLWDSALFTHPSHLLTLEAEFLPHSRKLRPTLLSLLGACSALLLYHYAAPSLYARKVSPLGRSLYTFLNRKWFFDKVYNALFTAPALHLGYHSTYVLVDRGVLELLGPHGRSTHLYQGSQSLSQLHTGKVYHSSLLLIVGYLLRTRRLFYSTFYDMDSRLLFLARLVGSYMASSAK